jgi:hypothetical protein
VSATWTRDREGRWCWRLTRESGSRPIVGCVQHIGEATEDVRGAYVVMEFALLSLCKTGTEWKCFVGCLDKWTVRTVFQIAEALKAAEKEIATLRRKDKMETSRVLFACLHEAFYNGWFSSDSCSCDAGGLFTDGDMCESCGSVRSQWSRFVAQDCFLGLYPLGREHWWKGVTDGVSAVALWRQARYSRHVSGVCFTCDDCFKVTREYSKASAGGA